MSTVTTAMPKRRGRPPKSRATEPEAEPPTPLRRGRPPKRSIPAPEPDADNEPEPRTRPKRLASKPAPDLEAPEQTESQNRQDRATARKKTKQNIESVKKDQDKEKDKDSASAQQTVSLKKTKKPHRRGREKNKKTSREENDTTKVAKENAGVVLAAGSGIQIIINDGAGVDILQDGQVSMQMADDYLNSSDSDNELALREDDAPNPIVEDAYRTDGGHDMDVVHDEHVDEETSVQIRTENTLHDDNEFTLSDQSLMEEIADEDKACGRTGIGDMSVHQLAAFLVKRGQSGEGTRYILRKQTRKYMGHWRDKQATVTGLETGDTAVVLKTVDKASHSTTSNAHQTLQDTKDNHGSPQVTHSTKAPIDKHEELPSSTHNPAKTRKSHLPQSNKAGLQTTSRANEKLRVTKSTKSTNEGDKLDKNTTPLEKSDNREQIGISIVHFHEYPSSDDEVNLAEHEMEIVGDGVVDAGDGSKPEDEESNLMFNNPNKDVISCESPVPMLEDEELDSVFDNPNEEVILRGTFAPGHMDAVDAFLDGDIDIDAVTGYSKNDADDGRNKEKTGLPAAIRSPGTVVVPSSTPKLEHMAMYNHGTVVDFWLYLRSLESKDLELTQVQQRALEHVAPKTWSPFANVHDVQLAYSSPTAKKKPAPLKRHFIGDKAPEPPGHYIWRMFFTKSKEQEGAVVHRIRQVLLLLAWSRFRREVPKWKENVLEGGGSISPIRRSKDINDVLSILRKDRNATAWQKRYRDLKVEAQWGAMYKDIVPPSMSALPSIEVTSSTSIFIPDEGFEELGVGLDRDAQDVGFLAGEFGEGGVLLLAIATPLVQMLEHGEGLGLLKSNGVTEALDHGYNVGIEQHALEYGVTEVAESVVDGMVDRLNECMLGQKG